MRVNCPHCHNPLDVVGDQLSDLTCPSCGTVIDLLSDDTVTYDTVHDALQTPTRLGHLELRERLGTGAVGTVWKARDTRLDRDVAVKIPRKGQLNPDETRLFLREAQAAAQLNHPNIVSVHEVGVYQDQIYIVSDYIEGVTLADWLTGHQPTCHDAAELCFRIAVALQHAHEAGIVHRDLKPLNIMLDGKGQPHIMDFGLAKRDSAEITMTLDGRALGTPAYMSPEQAGGSAHRADCRSDVYSLGVILFELLTGERPFRGNVRMLVHQVIHDDPPTPRNLNHAIPRDLETICLRCLRKEPNARFSSAQALADELQRFLGGEPIHSRRIGLIGRVWRSAKRNPVSSIAFTAAVASVIVALVATSIGYYSTRRALAETEQARQDAEAHRQAAEQAGTAEHLARQRAEDNFSLARSAIDDYLTKISQNDLLNVPGMHPLRKELLSSALDFYQTFVKQQSNDPNLRAELAAAHYRLAVITSQIGEPAEAMASYREAIELQQELVDDAPTAENRRALALSCHDLGMMQRAVGNDAAAREHYELAIAQQRIITRETPQALEYAAELSRTLQSFGLLLRSLGQLEDAEQVNREAIQLGAELVAKDPDSPVFQSVLAKGYFNLGLLQYYQGKRQAALASYERHLAIQQQLVERYPEDVGYRSSLASAYTNRGNIQSALRQFELARQSHQLAIEIEQKLVDENPDVYDLRSRLATSYTNLGNVQRALRAVQEAEDCYVAAIHNLTMLVTAVPSSPRFKKELAITYASQAAFLKAGGKTAEAIQAYRSALDLYELLEDASLELATRHAGTRINFGKLLQASGDPESALGHYDLALLALTDWSDQPDRHRGVQSLLRNAYWGRANAHEHRQEYAHAAADWKQALELASDSTRDVIRKQWIVALARSNQYLAAAAEARSLWDESAPGPLWYDLACVYSLCCQSLEADPDLDDVDRQRLSGEYLQLAVVCLEHALEKGYFSSAVTVEHARQDPDLKPLHDHLPFQEFLALLERE